MADLITHLHQSNPILLEALADTAHCTPHEAAEHLAALATEDPRNTAPVALFLTEYSA